MNRPGYWKTKDGEWIAITDMQDSHLKNSLRHLRNRILVENRNTKYRDYCDEKIVELGNEAQRRHLISPGDITIAQLITHIGVWQTEWNYRKSLMELNYRKSLISAQVPVSAASQGRYVINNDNRTLAKLASSGITGSLYFDAVSNEFQFSMDAIQKSKKLKLNKREDAEQYERRLDTDL